MPNDNTDTQNTPGTPPPENAIAHNKEVASKLAGQDISGQSTVANSNADDALDALMKQAEEKAQKAAEAEPVEPVAEPVEPVAEPKVEPKEGDTGTPPADPNTPPAAPEPKPEEVEAKKVADEIFKDSPSLPPGASPKSTEAFATVKIKAAKEISSLRQELDTVKTELKAAVEKLKNPIPDEVNRELTDLRQFRAKLDVELDPKFKEYDKSISQSQEFIYAQLRKSPAITDSVIAEIKKYGPENIKLEKIFAAVNDPTIQRLVESKVADIEQHKFNKEQAIKSAKENIGQYLAERQKEVTDRSASHNTATKTHLDGIISSKLDWLVEKKPAAGADEATKKAVEEHNQFITSVKSQLNEALSDDSPEMRAIMLAGMAQLFNTQRLRVADTAKIATLEKQLADSQALVTRLKGASRSRLPESSAPAGKLPENKDINVNTSTGDALDAIAARVLEERKAKGL